MDRDRRALVIIGAGGHAKVVIEALRAGDRYSIVGCTDAVPAMPDLLGVPILGDDEVLDQLFARGVGHAIVAIGDNHTRLRVGRSLLARGFQLANAIHPTATISPSARLGVGIAIMAGAVVNAGAVIGNYAIVNTLASVDHDCRLGDGVHVAPHCALTGGVTLGEGVFMGACSCVAPGLTIGAYSKVRAGGVVICDLEAGVIASGVPARPLVPVR